MDQKTTLDYVAAIGSVATPILVLLLTGIGWLVSQRFEKARERENKAREQARELEEKLRGYRTDIYNNILEPFVLLFTKDEGSPKSKEHRGKTYAEIALAKILSLDYKQTAFRFLLMGSDEVIRAYNNLMQFFYAQESKSQTEETTKEMMTLLGTLLLEIRRSVGNETTKLKHFEMLEFLITDIRKYLLNIGGPETLPNQSLDRSGRT